MAVLNQMDLIVSNVSAAADFFAEVVGMDLRGKEERFAELRSGSLTLMLSPDAMFPTLPAAGVILHMQVEDVAASLAAAREKGAQVLLEPTYTDWGWEMAVIAGPEQVAVSFYRLVR